MDKKYCNCMYRSLLYSHNIKNIKHSDDWLKLFNIITKECGKSVV